MMLDGGNVLRRPTLGKIEMNKGVLCLIGLQQVGEEAGCQRREDADPNHADLATARRPGTLQGVFDPTNRHARMAQEHCPRWVSVTPPGWRMNSATPISSSRSRMPRLIVDSHTPSSIAACRKLHFSAAAKTYRRYCSATLDEPFAISRAQDQFAFSPGYPRVLLQFWLFLRNIPTIAQINIDIPAIRNASL